MSSEKHKGEDNLPDCFIHPKDSIPKGPYCYSGSRNPADKNYKPCPYWEIRGTEEEYYGCCNYLDVSDDDGKGFGHLWDQVKECGINCDYDKV